jgi:putative signal transducing protein
MFCPRCGEEYRWYVMVCPTCDVDTVDRLPGPEPTPDVELVSVLATADPGVVAFAKSLLEREKIDYMVRGEGLPGLFGLGGMMTAFGPAELLVRADDADRARTLLEGLTTTEQKPDSSPDV